MRANEYVKQVIEEKGLTLYAVDKAFGNDYRGSDFYPAMNSKRYFTMKQILSLEKLLSIPAETLLALQIEDMRHDALKSMVQDIWCQIKVCWWIGKLLFWERLKWEDHQQRILQMKKLLQSKFDQQGYLKQR